MESSVNELLPFSAYDDPSEWPARRIATIMGLLWGIPFGLVMWATGSGAFDFVFYLAAGLIGGWMFGRLWAGTFRRSMIDLSRRIYEGDPGIVPSPPAGEYQFRVMGNLFRGRIAVGGHLYAGPERWVFVPHRKNLQRHQAPVEITPSRVEVVPAPLSGLSKVLTSRPSFAVRMCDPSEAVLLKTPEPNHVASKLRELVSGRASSSHTA